MRHVEEKSSMHGFLFPQVCCLHEELCQSDYVLEERTQDKLSNNKVQFITLFSGSAALV